MDVTNLESLTIAGARAAIADRRVSATALAEAHYTRIAAVDGPSGQDIHSYLALSRDRALAQAARVDALAERGDPLPPLAGVPVGIKDVLAMQGAPATAGSKILAGYRPPYDATAVRRLEAAGAVLLGKLNCDEFAMGSSNENSAYGPVRNPRDLARVPGGSSERWLGRSRRGRPVRRRRSAPTPAAPSASLLPSAASSACCPPTAASAALASSPLRARSTASGPLPARLPTPPLLLEVLAGPDPCDAPRPPPPPDAYSTRPPETACRRPPHRRARRVLRRGARPRNPRRHRTLHRRSSKAQGCTIHTRRCRTPATPCPVLRLATAEASSNLSRFDGVRFGLRAARRPHAQQDVSASRATKASALRSSAASCSAPTPSRPGTTTPTTVRRSRSAPCSPRTSSSPSRRSTSSSVP